MPSPESSRVLTWRAQDPERYNAYMRELRQRNPSLGQNDDLRKARKRAEKAGRPFDENAWLAGRPARQARLRTTQT